MGYVKTYRRSKNLFDKSNADIYETTNINSELSTWNKYTGSGRTVRISVSPSTNYAMSVDSAIETSVFRVLAVSTSDIPVLGTPVIGTILVATNEKSAAFTTPANTTYIIVQFTSAVFDDCINTLMLCTGSVPYSYEEYNTTAWYDFCKKKTATGWADSTAQKAPF